MSLLRCICRSRVSVQARGPCKHFVTGYVFTVRSFFSTSPNPQNWRTTPCLLSATAYPICSQLHSTLEAVCPSATWGRAMPWWEGPTYHGHISYTCIYIKYFAYSFLFFLNILSLISWMSAQRLNPQSSVAVCWYVNFYLFSILGAFATLRKATISFVISVRPSVCMEGLGSHWKDFN